MLKKNKKKIIFTLIVFFCALSHLRGAIFYVDVNGNDTSGTGNQSRPWKTLAYAVTRVPANLGNTIHLNAGIFTEIQTSEVPTGVNIEGAGSNNTILKGNILNSNLNSIPLISLQASPIQYGNQMLSNFKIDGNSKTLYSGIKIKGRHNVIIHDIVFSEIYFSGVDVTSGGAAQEHVGPDTYLVGFQAYNLSFNNCSRDMGGWSSGVLQLAHLENAVVHDITISENRGYGITYLDYGWFKGLKIYNCNINVPIIDTDAGSDFAIKLSNVYNDCEIYSNNCNGRFSFVYGSKLSGTSSIKVHDNKLIFTGTAQKEAVELVASDVELYNNYISGFGHGINIFGKKDINNVYIHNNTFFNQLVNQLLITVSKNPVNNLNCSITNVGLYNNVFDSVNGNVPVGVSVESNSGSYGPLSGFKIKNNIFMTENGINASLINTSPSVSITNSEVRYNCLYNTIRGNYSLGVSFGNNLENTDPKITKTGERYDTYYTLLSYSSLIDKGYDVGLPYFGSKPDIGRYEYTIPDVTAPSRIGNLSMLDVSSVTVVIQWTAPGDDGVAGTASFYDIRYSNVYSEVSNWSGSASKCGSELMPTEAGNIQAYKIKDLTPDTVYYVGIKVGDEVPNWSDVSNVLAVKTDVIPDTVPPGKIVDLAVSDYDSTSITLGWTAVGDDGSSGTANKYEIRRYNVLINDSNWALATVCDNAITVKSTGSNESFIVDGLTPNTAYYFAVKSADEVPNWSLVSNSVGATTLETGNNKPQVSDLAQSTIVGHPLGWGGWTTQQKKTTIFTISDKDEGNTFQYNIQFSLSSDFSSLYIDSIQPDTAILNSGATCYITSVLPEGRWFWRVRAIDNTGRYSDFASGTVLDNNNFGIDLSPPVSTLMSRIDTYITSATIIVSAADGLSGLNSVPDKIKYTKSQNFDTGSVIESDWFDVNGIYVEGLEPNTTYYFQAKTRDVLNNESSWTGTYNKVTKCNFPEVTWGEVYASSISIGWTNSVPGNPDKTRYLVELSSTNFKPGTVMVWSETTCDASGITIYGLYPRTVYWARVSAINYSNEASVTILGNSKITLSAGGTGSGGGSGGGGSGGGYNDMLPPDEVNDLMATPLGENKIKLDWLESTSDDIKNYMVYMSTGDMDYTTPSYIVSSTQTEITIDDLIDGQEYKFVVRAVDEYGNEDMNTDIVTETAVEDLLDRTLTRLSTPTNGVKISGTNVLLLAENLLGATTNIKEVTFEYRKVGDTDWTAVPVPIHVKGQSNPDTGYPYYMQWDVSSIANNQQLNLRARVTNVNGVEEEQPGYITIKIDHVDPDILETVDHKYERVDNRKLNIVRILDTYSNTLGSVKISTGVLVYGATDKIKIIMDPSDAPTVDENLIRIGYTYKIEFESGQTFFFEDLEISLPYKDEDNDGRTDDNDVLSNKLAIYTYNGEKVKWSKITSSRLNKMIKIVTCKTNHLSFFGVFAVVQSELVMAHVYPNPYKPSIGHTKIFFTNLTSHSKIQIFNTSGELVYQDERDTPLGELTWDTNNNDLKPVASGVYIFMIINDINQMKRGKLAIIR